MHSHRFEDVLSRAERRRPARARARARVALALTVLPLTVATIVGLVLLWPSGHTPTPPAFAAAGATFPSGQVVSLQHTSCEKAGGGAEAPAPPAPGQPVCGSALVKVSNGVDTGRQVRVDVPPDVMRAGLSGGVLLLRTPAQGNAPATYSLQDVQRGFPLVTLGVIFALVVVAVAKLRGLLALVGLGFATVVVGVFMLPALLQGSNAMWVGLTGSSAIMLVVLYLAHGLSARTTTALLGTFAGLGMTAGIAALAVRLAHLTGLSSDENSLLQSLTTQLNPRDLLTCGIILAGLGVLNDVTITQTSAVWELREAAPDLSAGRLFGTAMRIGRDHIASTIYTIVFAYAGAALPVLLLIELYQQPLASVLTSNDIAEELVRTLASAIGLVLAVPLTTALAVFVARADGRPLARAGLPASAPA